MDDKQHVAMKNKGGDAAFPRLLGGQSCLDFANTIEAPRGAPHDFLTDYTSLVRWGRHAGLLSDVQVAWLLAEAERCPAGAETTFSAALALRTAVQRTFAAIATRSGPDPPDLATIQAAYIAGLSHARLVVADGSHDWVWPDSVENHLNRLLWQIARSAVELLTAGNPARVRQCSGPDGCGWLFYDLSKNGSRRWCSMEGCGSHAKMRRYNARNRAAQR